mmetsp:Transcript_27748/g.31144  ORF Transcript_27748/g.31144 Transcript_27748/m.31144 type:complete len:390 (-) Transcript_27748:366-1535(-)|eukprot:CAMPEP_0170787460 /NCGR_PEP_ID=MMETSP0733-20121128/18301_1 /TAXON_ID=186038 /ORGANISM="Fragilariopsis kerguelensis, Strain L26-C5" /LENGTH=389 /DNA_ID=CAMNT_0011133681 /DNA_START=78 /DNA_END=1247 /DNA_ORIENTATION=+
MTAKRVLFAVALAASVCVSASAFTQNGATFASNTMLATKVRGGKGKASVAPKGIKKRGGVKLAADASGSKGASESDGKSSMAETIQVGTYFALWYAFNIAYNIYNKKALNVLAYPWTVATIQMCAGVLYFVPLWILGLRKAPKLNFEEIKTLIPIALCHTGVHVGAVIALGAGAVSFAHIVKASEPVVTCALNYLFLGQVLPLPVYLTLLPIIGGVAIASMKELSFTVLALAAAMLSNVSSSARGVLSKKTMSGKKIGENMDPQNLYAVLTAMSACFLIPTMLAIEGTGMFSAFKSVVAAGEFTNKSLASILALSGASYYAYNEVAFLALGKVNPVTHAVGNTIKRVVIIVASVIAFKTPMSTGSIIGSTIAIAGTLMYSLAMNASKKK